VPKLEHERLPDASFAAQENDPGLVHHRRMQSAVRHTHLCAPIEEFAIRIPGKRVVAQLKMPKCGGRRAEIVEIERPVSARSRWYIAACSTFALIDHKD
jgi:hypothetical protein